MINNVTTVTVKNQFDNLDVLVNTLPNSSTNNDTISAGDEMVVYSSDQSLSLQLVDMVVPEAETENSIPIGIDSMVDLNVEASFVKDDNKWTIVFDPEINQGCKSAGSNVNVTIGQDEPNYKSLFFLGIALGLLAGPLLYGISPILWGFAVGAALVGAAVAWYKSAVKKRKKRKEDPGK